MNFPCSGITATGENCRSVFLVYTTRRGIYYCRHHAPEGAVRINCEDYSTDEDSESLTTSSECSLDSSTSSDSSSDSHTRKQLKRSRSYSDDEHQVKRRKIVIYYSA